MMFFKTIQIIDIQPIPRIEIGGHHPPPQGEATILLKFWAILNVYKRLNTLT